jgi:hypothetical protein
LRGIKGPRSHISTVTGADRGAGRSTSDPRVHACLSRAVSATIPVLAMVAVFVFLMPAPAGDPAAIIAGDNAGTT